jgi:hypothetical protein
MPAAGSGERQSHRAQAGHGVSEDDEPTLGQPGAEQADGNPPMRRCDADRGLEQAVAIFPPSTSPPAMTSVA